VLPNNNNHRFDTPLNDLQLGGNNTKLAATFFMGQTSYLYQTSADMYKVWLSSVGRTGTDPTNATAVQAFNVQELRYV
jgi:hypothetical protein